MRLRRTLHTLVTLASLAPLLAPRVAQATQIARATSYETPPRKGFYGEIALRPGLVVLRDGLVPTIRHHFTFGAGLTDRFKLGMSLHFGGYFGEVKKPALGTDVVATGYVWRGLYLRGGLGVISRLPVGKHSATSTPGYGGLVGLGYEWAIQKVAGVGLGADFDMRMVSGREVRHSFLVGLHFHFH